MKESLALFDGVVNSRWFFSTSIILFLNKKDVFQDKLPRVPLERYFGEYTGGSDVSFFVLFFFAGFCSVGCLFFGSIFGCGVAVDLCYDCWWNFSSGLNRMSTATTVYI